MNRKICHICKSSICICTVKVCSCAGCGLELTRDPILSHDLFQSHKRDRRVRVLGLLADRIHGRPYCHRCVPVGDAQAEVVQRFDESRSSTQESKLRSA